MEGSSRSEGRAVRLLFLCALVVFAACGDRTNSSTPDTTIPDDPSHTPSLKDTLTDLFQGGAHDQALHLAEDRWRTDSLNWANKHDAETWHKWATLFHHELMDPLVGAHLERALGMMDAVIGAGHAHVPGEHLLLAALHKEHSKYLNRAGRKEDALLTARAGYDMLASTGDTITEEAIGLLNALGIRMFARGGYDAGIAYMNRSINIARSLQDPKQEATQKLRLAGLLLPADSGLAMRLFREAEATARAAGDTITWCTVLNGRSVYIFNNFGVYDTSAILRPARLINYWSGFSQEVYATNVGNAIVFCRENFLYFELEELLKGYERKVASQPFDPVLHAALRTSQAEAYRAMHDDRAAMAYATEAVALVREHGLMAVHPQTSLRACLILMATQSWANDHPAAIATAEEVLAIPAFGGVQERTMRSHIMANLANAQALNGDPARAIGTMSQFLEDPTLRHRALTNLGKYYRMLGEGKKADSCDFLVLRDPNVNYRLRGEAAIALSEDRAATGMHSEAEDFAREALVACGAIVPSQEGRPRITFSADEVSRHFDATRQWCRCLEGSLPMRTDQHAAKQELLDCDSVFRIHVDTLLRTTRDPMARTGLLDLMTESLDRTIRLLTEGDPKMVPWRKVLQLMELRRDHRWRSMQREEQAGLRYGVPDDLLRTERRLIGLLESMMRNDAQPQLLNGARSPMTLVRDSLMVVSALIRSIAPGCYSALNGLEPIDPGSVMKALAPGEHIVVLHLDTVDRTLVSVHVDHDTIVGQRGEMLADGVDECVHALRNMHGRDSTVSRALADLVFGTIGRSAPTGSLIILPDGPLWGVPFDVLWSATGSASTELTNIRNASSLTTLVQRSSQGARTSNSELFAFAPSYRTGSKGTMVSDRAGRLRDLGPLVANVEEVSEIVDLVVGSEYLATDANESGFRLKAPAAEAVHLAMHGVINAEEPFNSYLMFERVDSSAENDGRLTVAEIHDLKLRGDLAVLSA